MKKCSMCKQVKTRAEFSKNSTKKGGLQTDCKECAKVYRQENRTANKEYHREYRATHKKQIVGYQRKYRKGRVEELQQRGQAWRAKNPNKTRAYWQKKERKQRHDPKYRLGKAISHGIRYSLQRKGSTKKRAHWEGLVGYTCEQLISHIESLFEPGMMCENYGKWHIDHKIPISAFNFKTPEDIDFKRCWALSNLQPMWAKENISKGQRLYKPFQPSLRLGR